VAALTVAAVLATGTVLLLDADEGASAVGSLNPAGCVDDNDFATDPEQGPDNCANSANGLNEVFQLAVSPNGRDLYAIAGDDSAVTRFRIARDGKLHSKGCIDDKTIGADNCSKSIRGLGQPEAIVVSPDGRSVYVAAGLSESVVVFKRNKDTGALKPRGCVADNDTGTAACSKRTNGLGTVSALGISPDGKWLYSASEGDSAIVRFKRDTSTGALTPKGCIQDDTSTETCATTTASLEGATAVAVGVNGRAAYAAAEFENALTFFKRGVKKGKLTPTGCLEDENDGTGACTETAPGMTSPDSLVTGPEGRSLYMNAESDSAITRFALSKTTGEPTFAWCVQDDDAVAPECPAFAPALAETGGAAVSADGRSLYVTSGGEDAITRFRRNPDTGAIEPRGCIDDNDFATDPNQGEEVCGKSANGMQGAEWVAISPNDRFVYVAAEQDDAIALFRR
jgi:VCBS repeat-containing protein